MVGKREKKENQALNNRFLPRPRLFWAKKDTAPPHLAAKKKEKGF